MTGWLRGDWVAASCFGVALLWDVAAGELPNALHPVAWFGRMVGRLRAHLPVAPRLRALAAGVLLLGVGAGSVAALALLDHGLRRASPLLADLLALFWLQASFACRGLLDAGQVVERALAAHDVANAREGLGALCSRDPAALDESELAGAATASLAENLADSVVAPLLYFALFGLGGALLFRVVNTLDAMVGYRGRYEWLGKAVARADDLLGLVPARLSVVLLTLTGLLQGLPVARGLRVWRRDAALTASPNGGHPMALTAGLLGVRLDKPGVYVLCAEGGAPTPQTLAQARRLVRSAMALSAAAALTVVALSGRTRAVWDPLGWPW